MLAVYLTLAASAQLCASNNGSIRGRIYLGEEKASIPGVTVTVEGINIHTSTGQNGTFEFPGLADGVYTIRASCIGYHTERLPGVRVEAHKQTEVSLTLGASVFRLNEVVVTGSFHKHLLKDTPVVTEVITQDAIASVGSSDLADVMRAQTGIELGTSIGQTQSVRLHGLNKNQVLVLVDGERLTGKVDDGIDIGQIAVNTIERIEVVKGPLSSMYGSEALGGVVNIITKSAQSAPMLHAGLTLGT
jgi:outer membrane receptor for ferrienterochelin and colicins